MTAFVDLLFFLSIVLRIFVLISRVSYTSKLFLGSTLLGFYLSYATNLHDDLFYSIMLVWHSDRFSLDFAGVF